MINQVEFTKMHGAGNDYIYVDTRGCQLERLEDLAVKWSALHTGIGSDGLVLIGTSDIADFSMRIFNADGSEAMMCGNASRCIGKYVYEKGLTDKKIVTLETLSGIKELQLTIVPTGAGSIMLPSSRGIVKEVTVDMGIPVVGETTLELEARGMRYTGLVVSMGNPHFVIFVDDINGIDLPAIGPLLEHNSLFPNRTNVEFVQVVSPGELRMRVWERGSGITQACGTGACATAVAGVVWEKTGRTTKVVMDGGPLTIHWDKDTDKVFMTGDAVTVFEGTITI